MTSLRDMNARQQQWMAEKPQGDYGANLYLKKDDLVIFQFCSNGEDGQQLIKNYRCHNFETVGSNGRPRQETRYCPIKSGDTDIPCPHCAAGHNVIKERFAVWMYVHHILHTQMVQDKQFPQIQYEGRVWFDEEVNGFKLWDTSAWRESPWADIIKLNELYKGLNNFTAQINVVGEQLTRRFKLYPIPNSPFLDPGIYERAKAECQSIPDRLRAEINQAVAVNPQTVGTGTPNPTVGSVFAYAPIAAPSVAPFTAPGQSIPSLVLPGLNASPAPSSPTPIANFTTPTLVAPRTPVQQEEAETEKLAAAEAGAPDETPPFETGGDMMPSDNAQFTPEPEVKPTETARRPLKAMF